MLLTCQRCHTSYNLDPEKAGGIARKVRCAKCKHTWVHMPEGIDIPVAVSSVPHVRPPAEEEAMVQEPVIPAAVRPYTLPPMPVVDVHVMGMAPGQFGIFSFLFLAFVTLIVLFLFRAPITHAMPAMSGLYGVLGFDVSIPGEGLQFSEVRAQKAGGKMDITAKLSNISDAEIKYPKLRVEIFGVYGAVLKKWDVAAKGDALPPGGSVPVKLSFGNAPEESKTVEIKVAPY